MSNKSFAQLEVSSRAELRTWLLAHYTQAQSMWLVTWKRPDVRYLPYGDVVDELLCFGWVDSLPRKLDATRSMLLISPRKLKSAWSQVNKDRVERLLREGWTRQGLQRCRPRRQVAPGMRSTQWRR
jgi:uncharacterized protein YdeI (YjbR/CyaY-like superfamily)